MTDWSRAYEEHRLALWGLGYRMLGTRHDADEVVQETFAKAIARPPKDRTRPVGPWLQRVAMNVALDRLRYRRRRPYAGYWLPEPLPEDAIPDPAPGVEAVLSAKQSASYAFLVALEALTPNQRAVLLLREVLDWSVEETAEALGLSLTNVKTTHLRARKALGDRPVDEPTPELQARTLASLQRFLQALGSQDPGALQALFVDEARSLSDGGGEFFAARVPVIGADKIAQFYLGIVRRSSPGDTAIEVVEANGVPALLLRSRNPAPRWPPVTLMRFEVDADDRVREVHAVVHPAKLTAYFHRLT